MSEQDAKRRRQLLQLAALGPVLAACAKPVAPTEPAPTPSSSTPPSALSLPPATPSNMAEDSTVTANSNPVVVDVWHDLVCPWCRIGCHQLLAAADRFSAESGGRSVSIRYQPFLLEPSTPPEGYDLRARLASKYGAARLDQMFAMVTQRGAAIGLHFDFAKIRTSPSTVAGHALLGAASPSQQRPLLEALHQGYFERGENLGDLKVLTEAALVAQMDPGHVADVFADKALHDQIRASAQAASRSGIDGVPHFRFGTKVLHGAQPVEALLAAMRG
jgi:predicted DsbA family dithiol-disulfide isomerase